LAPRWWLFIRDDQLTLGTFVKVVVLGLALSDNGETEKKRETNCTIQNRTSPRVSVVYFMMVSFNV
jgi:hypothetical protein